MCVSLFVHLHLCACVSFCVCFFVYYCVSSYVHVDLSVCLHVNDSLYTSVNVFLCLPLFLCCVCLCAIVRVVYVCLSFFV